MAKNLTETMTLFKVLIAFVQFVKDPAKLDKVLEISRKVGTPEVLGNMGKHAASSSSTAKAALEQRPRIDLVSLFRERNSLPENSLGKEFIRFLEERNLNPADLPHLEANDENEFVQAHLYETHDLWHVVCGFETDVAGELGLQGVYLRQMAAPLSAIIMAGGLINTAFFAMDDRTHRMEEIIRGWSLAKKAKPLFGVNWNEFWRRPLTEVRAQFEIS